MVRLLLVYGFLYALDITVKGHTVHGHLNCKRHSTYTLGSRTLSFPRLYSYTSTEPF